VGVRIPNNNIPLAIVERLGFPLATASVKDDDEVVEYTTDPELIAERYDAVVDMVIDGGYGSLVPTTLVDLTSGEPEILREGGGELK
jgi:tRNA A37 threonylcarbamoyladenosine synthetase subunit TsaC/SUA5/YrdC